jgi:hypothetical protein
MRSATTNYRQSSRQSCRSRRSRGIGAARSKDLPPPLEWRVLEVKAALPAVPSDAELTEAVRADWMRNPHHRPPQSVSIRHDERFHGTGRSLYRDEELILADGRRVTASAESSVAAPGDSPYIIILSSHIIVRDQSGAFLIADASRVGNELKAGTIRYGQPTPGAEEYAAHIQRMSSVADQTLEREAKGLSFSSHFNTNIHRPSSAWWGRAKAAELDDNRRRVVRPEALTPGALVTLERNDNLGSVVYEVIATGQVNTRSIKTDRSGPDVKVVALMQSSGGFSPGSLLVTTLPLAGVTAIDQPPWVKIEGEPYRRLARRAAVTAPGSAATVTNSAPSDGVRSWEEGSSIYLAFPSKPSFQLRGGLKRAGFRWSKNRTAWHAYASTASRAEAARHVPAESAPPPTPTNNLNAPVPQLVHETAREQAAEPHPSVTWKKAAIIPTRSGVVAVPIPDDTEANTEPDSEQASEPAGAPAEAPPPSRDWRSIDVRWESAGWWEARHRREPTPEIKVTGPDVVAMPGYGVYPGARLEFQPGAMLSGVPLKSGRVLARVTFLYDTRSRPSQYAAPSSKIGRTDRIAMLADDGEFQMIGTGELEYRLPAGSVKVFPAPAMGAKPADDDDSEPPAAPTPVPEPDPMPRKPMAAQAESTPEAEPEPEETEPPPRHEIVTVCGRSYAKHALDEMVWAVYEETNRGRNLWSGRARRAALEIRHKDLSAGKSAVRLDLAGRAVILKCNRWFLLGGEQLRAAGVSSVRVAGRVTVSAANRDDLIGTDWHPLEWLVLLADASDDLRAMPAAILESAFALGDARLLEDPSGDKGPLFAGAKKTRAPRQPKQAKGKAARASQPVEVQAARHAIPASSTITVPALRIDIRGKVDVLTDVPITRIERGKAFAGIRSTVTGDLWRIDMQSAKGSLHQNLTVNFEHRPASVTGIAVPGLGAMPTGQNWTFIRRGKLFALAALS